MQTYEPVSLLGIYRVGSIPFKLTALSEAHSGNVKCFYCDAPLGMAHGRNTANGSHGNR